MSMSSQNSAWNRREEDIPPEGLRRALAVSIRTQGGTVLFNFVLRGGSPDNAHMRRMKNDPEQSMSIENVPIQLTDKASFDRTHTMK
jgi:hypothetical protein